MARRRRYNKRKPANRRETPATIECYNAPEDHLPVVVKIGNETYTFSEDETGRRMANVYVEEHITCFLARGEMYRQAGYSA